MDSKDCSAIEVDASQLLKDEPPTLRKPPRLPSHFPPPPAPRTLHRPATFDITRTDLSGALLPSPSRRTDAPAAMSIPPPAPRASSMSTLVTVAGGALAGVALFVAVHATKVAEGSRAPEGATGAAAPAPAALVQTEPVSAEPAAPAPPPTAAAPPPAPLVSRVASAAKATAATPGPRAPGPATPESSPPSEATSTAGPPASAEQGPSFDKGAAALAFKDAAQRAAACWADEAGTSRVRVTFAPSGRATQAVVSGDFQGTPTGSCIARAFGATRVPAFDGEPVSVTRTVTLP